MEQLQLFDIYDYTTKTIPQPVPDRLRVARFLHLGAGVQSSVLAESMAEGEIAPADVVIFADTGNEPPWVYEQVQYLTDRLATVNIPLETVRQTPGGLVVDASGDQSRFVAMPLFTKDENGKIGMMRRQCTKEYKITPCDDFILQWMIDHNHGSLIETKKGQRRIVSRKVYVENIYGISLDEWERSGKRGPKWQRAVYPLIESRMTRKACIDWLKDRGLRVPYKSSCIVCPFHENSHWLYLSLMHPSVFEEACQFDDWLRTPEAKKKLLRNMNQPCFLHRSCQPLRTVDFSNAIDSIALCGDHCMT